MEASGATPSPEGNIPEFGVVEISAKVRSTVEQAFERVRVRGEVGRVTRAASGHVYLSLKEDNAVLDCVCWRAAANRLKHAPEQGLEMVATGRLTTYPGRSNYQLVVESLEPAGLGALMVLLEKRRRQLEAEGLFDAARKKRIPLLPGVIGVVTSPTGAVIRDILHRLNDRFPLHVLLWPVTVQGEDAARQVAAAIHGFNDLEAGGGVPRPDLIIVARGGGSFEDLMPFNEEIVVRAAAASAVPLISAIGHETDTTLIDHAADLRAPTPSAAAEMAVPVRSELLDRVALGDGRLVRATTGLIGRMAERVAGLARGLPRPGTIVDQKAQDLDRASRDLDHAMSARFAGLARDLGALAETMPRPAAFIAVRRAQLAESVAGMSGRALAERVERSADRLRHLSGNLDRAMGERTAARTSGLSRLSQLLESLSYRSVLERGYAVVRSGDTTLTRAAGASQGDRLAIEFSDATLGAVVDDGGGTAPPRRQRRSRPAGNDDGQFQLF